MHHRDQRPIIVAGHICLDIIPEFIGSSLPAPGALTQIGPAAFAPGGAVANVGVALAKLGAPTRLIAAVGVDPMGRILRLLLPSNADVRLTESSTEPTSYSVVVAPVGQDRSFLHCPGVNHAFDPAAVSEEMLAGAGALHFGYPPAMRSIYRDHGNSLAGMFARARRAGVRTSLDLCGIDRTSEAGRVDWNAWFRRVLPEVDLFTPSVGELCDALQCETPRGSEAHFGLAAKVLDLGCAAVALKCGEDGLLIRVTGDRARLSSAHLPADWAGVRHVEPCFSVDVATATGAGDTTIAGLLLAIQEGESAQASAALATGVGAFSCEAADATSGIPDVSVVRARIAAGWIKRKSRLIT